MNQLQIITITLLLINKIIAQECSVSTNINILYPTTTESFTVNLLDIFKGQNMTFKSSDPDFKVVNYADPVDSGTNLRSYQQISIATGVTFVSNAIFTLQDNQEWNGQTAMLGTINQQYFVYPATFSSKQSPLFENGIAILQGKSLQKCVGLTYLNQHQVIVDCFYDDAGLLVNQWQIIETINKTQYATVVPSSNIQNQLSGNLSFGRIIQFWKNVTSGNGYIFRGTLNNIRYANFLEVFLFDNGIPQKDPIMTLSKTNITNLQIVDFKVAPNGTLWVLNKTNVILTYQIDEGSNQLIFQGSMKIGLHGYQYRAVEIDFTTRGYYSILLSKNTRSLEEWVVVKDRQPIIIGYYELPIDVENSGFPTQMGISSKYVYAQNEGYVYIFSRGDLNFSPARYFTRKILTSAIAIYAKVNKFPYNLLLYTQTTAQVSNLSRPTLLSEIQILKSGNFNLTAFCGNQSPLLDKNVTFNIDYQTIQGDNITIMKTGIFKIPNKALYPVNITIDVSEYFSGPLINISGVVTSEQQILQGSQQSNESLIIDSTSSSFDMNVKGYPTQGIIYALNSYDSQTDNFVQFLHNETHIQGFLCYKETFDIDSNCYSLGTLELNAKILKSAIMYTKRLQPYALLVIPVSNSTLNIYQVQWSAEDHSGSINVLYTNIDITFLNHSITITDFAFAEDSLFVVLNEIKQVWVYSFDNNQATKLYVITQKDLNTAVGFYPIGILGYFAEFGPIILIDNQVEVLIISTVQDKIQLMATVTYPLELPGMTTLIKIVGTDMLIIQYKEGDLIQQQITHYSLQDLTNPTMLKTLPLYGANLKFPFQIISDQNFLYVLMTNNVLNVYKPSASAHGTLYRQYNNSDNMVFSGTSAGVFSYVLIIDGNVNKNFKLYFKPTLTYVPGSYNNQYITDRTYVLTLTNSLGSVPIIMEQTVQIYNSQLEINIDQQYLQPQITNLVVSNKGQTVFNIDTENFVKGNVAYYTVDCLICRRGDIQIINYLSKGYFDFFSLQVMAMVNHPTKKTLFISSPFTINEYRSVFSKSLELLCTFPLEKSKCNSNVLFLDQSNDRLVSICNNKIQLLDLTQTPYSVFMNYQLPNISQTSTGVLIGDTLFLLAINSEISTQPSISILKIDPVTNLTSLGEILLCTDPINNGVNDISITEMKNIVSLVDGIQKNQTIYALLWTCQSAEQGVQYSTFIFDELTKIVGTLQPQQKLNTSNFIIIQKATSFPLLNDTIYLQVQTLSRQVSGDSVDLNILITTNNVMSFIFQINFKFEDTITSIVSQHLVITIPPYGQWTAMNTLSFNGGLLGIPYLEEGKKKIFPSVFLAIYNLNGLNYSKSFTTPLFMLGGSYESLYMSGNKLILNILDNNSTAQNPHARIIKTLGQSGLSYLTIQSQIQIVVDTDAPFEKQTVLVTAENYYTQQQFNFYVDYYEHQSGGIKWWGWILIIIFVILAAFGITIFMKKKQHGHPPLEQSLLIN